MLDVVQLFRERNTASDADLHCASGTVAVRKKRLRFERIKCGLLLTHPSDLLFWPQHPLVKRGWISISIAMKSTIGTSLQILLTWSRGRGGSTVTKDMLSGETLLMLL
jgi:hypothetical protein